ncbi:hypothetical protein HDV00_004515 [Rhizophlyctis rosea]|nr:hypothetical protein HDV00_004515 [Rhizophlyctis rosea]
MSTTVMETKRANAYDRELVHLALSRVRGSGGIPLTEAYKKSLRVWYGTLASRGMTTPEFLGDPDYVSKAYRETFPNPHSRCQFTRGFLKVIGGLTDKEFGEAYPGLTREGVVTLMKKVVTEGNREAKEAQKNKSEQTRPNAP